MLLLPSPPLRRCLGQCRRRLRSRTDEQQPFWVRRTHGNPRRRWNRPAPSAVCVRRGAGNIRAGAARCRPQPLLSSEARIGPGGASSSLLLVPREVGKSHCSPVRCPGRWPPRLPVATTLEAPPQGHRRRTRAAAAAGAAADCCVAESPACLPPPCAPSSWRPGRGRPRADTGTRGALWGAGSLLGLRGAVRADSRIETLRARFPERIGTLRALFPERIGTLRAFSRRGSERLSRIFRRGSKRYARVSRGGLERFARISREGSERFAAQPSRAFLGRIGTLRARFPRRRAPSAGAHEAAAPTAPTPSFPASLRKGVWGASP